MVEASFNSIVAISCARIRASRGGGRRPTILWAGNQAVIIKSKREVGVVSSENKISSGPFRIVGRPL